MRALLFFCAVSLGAQTFPAAGGSASNGVPATGSGIVKSASGTASIATPAVDYVKGGVGALTDGATIATDVSAASHFRVTLGGNRTLSAPTNPADGQKVTWELIQDGTGSRTITLDPVFVFGTDVTGATLTTTASKRDFLGAIYNSTTTKWYVVSFAKGY